MTREEKMELMDAINFIHSELKQHANQKTLDFVDQMLDRYDSYGSGLFISEKQETWLREIVKNNALYYS